MDTSPSFLGLPAGYENYGRAILGEYVVIHQEIYFPIELNFYFSMAQKHHAPESSPQETLLGHNVHPTSILQPSHSSHGHQSLHTHNSSSRNYSTQGKWLSYSTTIPRNSKLAFLLLACLTLLVCIWLMRTKAKHHSHHSHN